MKFLIIDKVTNAHFSTADTAGDVANPLPEHLKVVEADFDRLTQKWDVATSTVVPIPVVQVTAADVDRIAKRQLMKNLAAKKHNLPANEQATLLCLIAEHLLGGNQ